MKKIISLLVIAFALTGCFEKELKDPNLVIKSQNTSVGFKLEHAITSEQLTKGLQNRTELAKKHGMLFDIRPARNINMWMKDTLIPLDMIFVDQDNKIIKVVENTVPMSTDIIDSGGVVRAVIEINAGEAKKYDIKVGNSIETEMLKPACGHNHGEEAPKTE